VADDLLVALAEAINLAAELLEALVSDLELTPLGGALAADELVERDLEDLGELDDMVELRLALPGLPAGDESRLDVEELGELELGELPLSPQSYETFPELGHRQGLQGSGDGDGRGASHLTECIETK
jgi:hypothetical protein